MKYIIHCLLRGKAADYQRALVKDIAEKFDTKLTLKQNLAPHFTLKYWFETEDIKKVENLISAFCQTHKKAPVTIGGFGGFAPKTLFINIKLSETAQKTFNEFVEELKKLPWMTWSQYDAEHLHFHVTIAEQMDEKKYQEVLEYLDNREEVFDGWFDNITILQETEIVDRVDMWKVHKMFSLH